MYMMSLAEIHSKNGQRVYILDCVMCTQCVTSRRPIAADVAWSACLCVGHTGDLGKNGLTVRDAIWGLTLLGPRNLVR